MLDKSADGVGSVPAMTSGSHESVPSGRTTLQDIARKAGVSVVTVSRVINNSPLVRAELAEKVQKVVKELSYIVPALEKRIKRPRVVAKWRTHQSVGLILVGVFDFKWICDFAPVYSYVIQGIQNALRDADFGLVIHQVPAIEDLGSLPRHLRVDGFILLAKSHARMWPEELTRHPIVTVMGASLEQPCDHISYDNIAAGRVAANYFINKGILDVAVISSSGVRDVLKARADAFAIHMKEAGGSVLELQSTEIVHYGKEIHEMDEVIFRGFVEQFAARTPRPKGLFLTVDMMAPIVYRLLREVGIQPGRDVDIISCNNERPFLAGLDPRPVTVDIQAEKIGNRAVQQLLWRMQNRREPHITILIEPTLKD
jgi:LacI family transcriptional regulator